MFSYLGDGPQGCYELTLILWQHCRCTTKGFHCLIAIHSVYMVHFPIVCQQRWRTMTPCAIYLFHREYEELAIGVLNECYNDDPERTSVVLVREQEEWGNVTNLATAKHAENRNFIAHSGVQNLLTEIWNGKLSDENNYWLVSLLGKLELKEELLFHCMIKVPLNIIL